jgi:bifunctional UDP-N-acetylglucosamine pyrophosphorylase/glucosamine-1-phosphate N-acetyltransferase
MKLGVVILAAGQGTRMKSSLPKVLHRLAGKPLLQHVIDTAATLSPKKTIIVFGHGGEQVRQSVSGKNLIWVEQAEQLGTGHAVQQTREQLADLDRVLILYGDVPLTSQQTLQKLLAVPSSLGLLTAFPDDPSGYGRIERNEFDQVNAIVEQKDANSEQIKIKEINTGMMVVEKAALLNWLSRLQDNNAQKEFYLTDIVGFAVNDGVEVIATHPDGMAEVSGVNDRIQLAELERFFQMKQARQLMRDGVTLRDPARVDIRGNVTFGADCEVDINVVIEGNVTIGNNVSIGANTVIRDCVVEDNVTILENCVFEDAHIGKDSKLGPYSRLRPGAYLEGNAHVGNFVEIKKSRVAFGSKVNHLTYIGDSEIGKNVNIGAGTITCNYDGANKHKTIIGDNAFIGSNSALVAPVTIGSGVTIGAGSVITRDAKPDTLTLTRGKQLSIENWKRPEKNKT